MMPTEKRARDLRRVYGLLCIAVFAGSLIPILTRGALGEGVPPLMIAAFRMSAMALLLTPIALAQGAPAAIRRLPARDLGLLVLCGALTGLGFVVWNFALALASVLVAVVLVNTSPLWTALLEVSFLKMRLTRLLMLAMAVTLGGNLLITLASNTSGGALGTDDLLGGLLALASALIGAGQQVTGRQLRATVSIVPFLWMIHAVAAVVALGVVLATGTPIVGYPLAGYGWLVLITIVGQGIAYSIFNFALKDLSATVTNLFNQGGPVISAGLAFVLLGEVPTPLQLVGAAIILVGVSMVIVGGTPRPAPVPAPTPPVSPPNAVIAPPNAAGAEPKPEGAV